MKKRKTMRLASLLLVCVLVCGMLASFASAAETYILTVKTSAANVRREPNTRAEVIGNLMRGDEFKTSSEPTAAWYYGLPGPNTAYFQEFGYTFGYVNCINFQ